MKRDPRYGQWLMIADELERLHGFLYGTEGCWPEVRNTYHEVVDLMRSAEWIRNKCATGWWYWWDKTTIAAQAGWPLRSLYRVLSEGALVGTEEGDKVTARIERLEAQIAAISRY